jgi:hypothetical protein
MKNSTEPLFVVPASKPEATARNIAADNSLFDIDRELNLMLDMMDQEIEEQGQASNESMERFTKFCEAFGEKIDRIGGFIRVMEARANYCKSEGERLSPRGKAAQNKVKQMQNLVLYYLASHEMTKVEGHQFTLRRQKNGQDSVRVLDEGNIPTNLRRIEAKMGGSLWERVLAALPEELASAVAQSVSSSVPSNEAIKQFISAAGPIDGVKVVRDYHLRVA